jgi:cytochrome b6-f complex iron-sulfur subunit
MSNDNVNEAPPEVESDEQDSFTRRGFVRVAAVAVGVAYTAAIGYPIYKYLHAPIDQAIADARNNTISLKDADKLPAGSTLMFMFKSAPSMLIHFDDGTWVALSAVCTHLGCTLSYQSPSPLIICPCHGGQYDPHTGKNVGGPPPRPLTKFDVQVEPGKVIVTQP